MKRLILFCAIACAPVAPHLEGQTADASYFSAMRWRMIGPHRAGRVWTVAAEVPVYVIAFMLVFIFLRPINQFIYFQF